MAVEARHLNFCAPQILSNRELMMMMNSVEGNGKTTPFETVPPINGISPSAMKSDGCGTLTYAVPISRKRSRDVMNPLLPPFPTAFQNQTGADYNRCGSNFTFLGEDLSYPIQQQQLEIDRFITQHTEKVRIEIEEKRKRFSLRIAAALEENVRKRLKSKDEEINKIGKLNWQLQEKVKSLFVENQIWRDLAQTNEATANALKFNLEQILSQINDDHHHQRQSLTDDDAQSCCGSNFQEIERRTVADRDDGCTAPSVENNNRMCRRCGREESCVLVLPCRHLCLCTVCGSSIHTCPVCNSTKTASVHLNLSS